MRRMLLVLAAVAVLLCGCVRVVDGSAQAPRDAVGWGKTQGAAVTLGGKGDVAAQVTVFLDFQCPFCKRFEEQYGEAINKNVTDGRLALSYRPVTFLDSVSASGDYSSRAAAAFFLVADSGAPDPIIEKFVAEMYRQQPEEGVGNLDNAQISGIAAGVGVKPATVREIAAHQLTDADKQRTAGNEDQLSNAGLDGVPGVVNGATGEIIDDSDPNWLEDLVGKR